MSDAQNEQLGQALGAIPSGLFIVTVGTGDEATGFLASFVQQVGFEPPVVTVAIKKGRHVLDLVRSGGRFVVSVIDPGSMGLLKHFARGFEPGQPAFEGLDVVLDDHDVPAPAGALARISCEVVGEADWTDHVLVAGKATGGSRRADSDPSVHLRKNGFSY
ncbi:MAG: flavin reductase family protein [Planctomycetota bacterium]